MDEMLVHGDDRLALLEYKMDCVVWLVAEQLYKQRAREAAQRFQVLKKALANPEVQEALASRIAVGRGL